jgi:hypothetical protein
MGFLNKFEGDDKSDKSKINPKSYGKKCKCGHFESDHVNLNKKFYEPNAIPEMGMYMHPAPKIENPRTIKCRGCTCDKFSPEKKAGCFGDDKRLGLHSFHFYP